MEFGNKSDAKTFCHHWFFDFDGTLARTGEDIVLAWKKTIAEMGLSCPHFDEVFRIGPTLEKMAYELFDNVTPELVAELTERFKPNYDESGFPNTVPYPGVIEKLNHLKEQGSKIYIVTNKRHAATQKIVKALGWEDLFDGVWSFDSFADARYKKPDLLARLLKDLNVSPDDAVMVGDTKGDIDAGKANGVRTIGVTWGYGTKEELVEADEICELN
jgi:phosphoglycolate phosphatase